MTGESVNGSGGGESVRLRVNQVRKTFQPDAAKARQHWGNSRGVLGVFEVAVRKKENKLSALGHRNERGLRPKAVRQDTGQNHGFLKKKVRENESTQHLGLKDKRPGLSQGTR